MHSYIAYYFINMVYCVVVGIDVEQLISDLTLGIRLPRPNFCSQSIEVLLENCFYEEPMKRPSFEEIIVYLDKTYNKLFDTRSEHKPLRHHGLQSNTSVKDAPKNNEMYFRYTAMIRGNKEQKQRVHNEIKTDTYLDMTKCLTQKENADKSKTLTDTYLEMKKHLPATNDVSVPTEVGIEPLDGSTYVLDGLGLDTYSNILGWP